MASWPISPWKLEARTVFGGWQIARARWVRTGPDGDDTDEEFEWVKDRTVYPTQEECGAAIARNKEGPE